MSDTLLKVEIVTPRSTAYSAVAQAITLPGTLGPFQVLINHAPIISSLESGLIKIIDEDGRDVMFAADGGFAEVRSNVVSIVVESAEAGADIDLGAAEAELSRIEERIAAKASAHGSDDDKRSLKHARNRVAAAQAMRSA
ncbi:MAG: ATP synthase F1 subunit epsilon [Candidatus Kapaibacterium sp.]